MGLRIFKLNDDLFWGARCVNRARRVLTGGRWGDLPSLPDPSPAVYSPGSEAMGLKGSRLRLARTRGVAAGRSAERGTSAATTGGGGRSAPDPDRPYSRRPTSVIREAQAHSQMVTSDNGLGKHLTRVAHKRLRLNH